MKYTVEVGVKCTKWYKEGTKILHRENGPAIEWTNGEKHWLIDDKFHRVDGPASEFASGTKYWYKNGLLHREDGPAREFYSGQKEWYLNGECLSEEEFLKKINSYDGKVVEIDGKKYTLTCL